MKRILLAAAVALPMAVAVGCGVLLREIARAIDDLTGDDE